MPRRILALLLVLGCGSLAAAHGGRYRGPVGEVPPSEVDPRDPWATEPIPRSGRFPGPLTFEHWLFWWHLNKDGILAEHRPVRPLTETEERLADRVVLPVLRMAAANPKLHPDIRGGAVIALARASRGPDELERILRSLEDSEPIVRESAVVALAMLGAREDRVLARLRVVAGCRDRTVRERCFAMIALGLLRDDSEATLACLLGRFDGGERTMDARVAAILALGLIGDRRRVPAIIGAIRDRRLGEQRKLSDLEVSHLVDALGRIGDPAALDTVADVLSARKGRMARRAAAIALGRLIPRAGAAAAGWPRRLPRPRSISDRTTAGFLLISLGRMAAKLPEAGRVDCRRRLLHALARQRFPVGYADIALALGFPGDEDVADRLRGRLGSHANQESGAAALALGLLGDGRKETIDRLIELVRDRGLDPHVRGPAATALGLIGGSRAAGAIDREIRDRENRAIRLDLVLAAGLAPGEGTSHALLAALLDPKASQYLLGACADAIGRTRDFRLLRPLVTILEPGAEHSTRPDPTRAACAIALGLLADRRRGDVLARLSTDLDWRASVPALDHLLSIR